MGTDFKSVPLPVLFEGFARHGLVEFMTAVFTTEKDAAFPDTHHASEIKLRPLFLTFRAGKAFKPGGGIGI
jgi:hypothetical protein